VRLAGIAGALFVVVACHATPPRPWTFRSDFSSGTREAWESYPLAEDAGYDPTLEPGGAGSERYLARIVTPHRDGALTFGVVHRFAGMAGKMPSLSFDYQLPYGTGRFRIEIQTFHRQKREVQSIQAEPSVWRHAAVRLTGIPERDPIDAISIVAVLNNAVTGRSETFRVARIELHALREPVLALKAPDAIWDDHRLQYYVRRDYRPGELVSLEADAAGVTAELFNPAGALVSTAGEHRSLYRFSADDPVGIWTVRLASAAGSARILLLLRPGSHRGLWFDSPPQITPELLTEVRERVRAIEPRVRPDLGFNIALYSRDFLLPGLPSYFALLEPPAQLALWNAVLARYTGSDEPARPARQILRSMAEWPTWVHPWFRAHGYGTYYPVGRIAADLVLAREFLADRLPPDESAALDRALLEKCVRPAFTEYVLGDRLIFNTSNWISYTAGGALLAALASRDRDAAGYALGLYAKWRDHIQSTYFPEGSYGEGATYLKFDLEMASLIAAAAKRLLGQDLDGNLVPAYRGLLYASYGQEQVLDFGDAHPELTPIQVLAYAAAQGDNSALRRFYRAHAGRDEPLLFRLLWGAAATGADRDPHEEPPPSIVFRDRGVAILRSGWSPDATVVTLRSGPHFNHNHADQGSVRVAANGRLLLGEAGYADYYKDPYYPVFNIQAAGHNTLLIDGDPGSQIQADNMVLGGFPTITTASAGAAVEGVCADLTAVYRDRLTSYSRAVAFRRDGFIGVVDSVRAKAPHRYSVVWHPEISPARISGGEKRFELESGPARLVARAFGSVGLSLETAESPLPLAAYARSESERIRRPVEMRFTTTRPADRALIVTLLAVSGEAERDLETANWKDLGTAVLIELHGHTIRISATPRDCSLDER